MINFASRLPLYMACFLLVVFMSSCATKAPARSASLSFDAAITQVTDDLFAQTSQLPGFLSKIESKLKVGKIVIDPILDATTGQQTEVGKVTEQLVVQRIADKFPQFDVLRFNATELGNAQYVLTGTLVRSREGAEQGQYRLALALTEFKTELVVAQASVRISDGNLDTNPTAFYRDSPAIAKDRIIEGYIRTTETQPGLPADAIYLERLPTSSLIADANTAYSADHVVEALALYEAAAKRPDGQQLRVLNGIYIAQWRLQHLADAEKAFSAIVRLGLVTNNLSLKLLFKPGTTDFINDTKISGPYTMWLRQIARQVVKSAHCVTVVGHTSRTGAENANDRLSLQRASVVRKSLQTEVPELAARLRESGMGYRENIIGTGSDDARDALDRRVEFRVVECKQVTSKGSV